jgi:hypothetical protein
MLKSTDLLDSAEEVSSVPQILTLLHMFAKQELHVTDRQLKHLVMEDNILYKVPPFASTAHQATSALVANRITHLCIVHQDFTDPALIKNLALLAQMDSTV